MSNSELPEAILTRFRSLSLERLASIEATWASVVAGVVNPSAIHAIARELHTLKGDAGGVGFQDVHVLAERLEELFGVAAGVEYRMPEDLELVITIALQFIALLLRKKEGSSGIDVPGFLRQVDEVLRDARTAPIATPSAIRARRSAARDAAVDRVSEATRHRLAIAATTVFLESLGARATGARQRLRGVWSTMCDEIARFQAVSLAKLLDRHVATAGRMATEVGKQVAILVEVGDVRVDARVAEAIDVALQHLLRNAIDHGIERRGVRRA
jgi:two-component system chemotaxis sensor kinase CheA